MSRKLTHRGLVLPFIDESRIASLESDDVAHPDIRRNTPPNDSPFDKKLSPATQRYWRNFIARYNTENYVSPVVLFLSNPIYVQDFFGEEFWRSDEEEFHRTQIAFDVVRNAYMVPKLVWKQLLEHSEPEQLALILTLKTGLIKRDINWLSLNNSLVPVNADLHSLYQLVIASVYDLDAMDYLITLLIVKGFMTQELSIWFINYLHKVMPEFPSQEEKDAIRFVRNFLVDWNKVTRGVPTSDGALILRLLGTVEPV